MSKSLLICLFITFNCFGFSKSVSNIIKEQNKSGNFIGIHFYDVDQKKVLFKHNEKFEFIPASTFKVLTAYYLLKTLGPDFQFSTFISVDGDDIILDLDGDPYLQSAHIVNMAISIKEEFKKKAINNIIISTHLPNIERIGDVGLDDQPYNQGISSFNLNFNRFRAYKKGSSYSPRPMNSYLDLSKAKAELGAGVNFKHSDTEGQEKWVYSPNEKYTYDIPIRDPLLFNAHYLYDTLESMNVKVKGNILIKNRDPKKIIYQNKSLKLLRLIELGLEYSNNLFMEVFLLRATGKDSIKDAAQVLKKFYATNFPKLNFDKVNFIGGSGLSIETKLTINQISEVLSKIGYEQFNGKRFMTLLSIAGSGGYLAKKYLDKNTYESFFAKTGSIDYVNTICGLYFKGRKISFCVMINNTKKRNMLTGKNSKSKELLRINAKVWKRNTDKILEEIITNFFSQNGKN